MRYLNTLDGPGDKRIIPGERDESEYMSHLLLTLPACHTMPHAHMPPCIPTTLLALNGSPQVCGATGSPPVTYIPSRASPPIRAAEHLQSKMYPFIYQSTDTMTHESNEALLEASQQELLKQLQGSRAAGDDRLSAVHGES